MNRFILEPHVGTGGILFGMTRAEVHSVLGVPAHSSEKSVMTYGDISIPMPAKDGYFENELQITYDDEGKADFVEFHIKDAKFTKVELLGIDVSRIPAPELVNKIRESANSDFDETDNEIPYSYVFPWIDLGLWRQVIPEQDEQTAEIPESNEGKYFWSIGIGKKGYYNK